MTSPVNPVPEMSVEEWRRRLRATVAWYHERAWRLNASIDDILSECERANRLARDAFEARKATYDYEVGP